VTDLMQISPDQNVLANFSGHYPKFGSLPVSSSRTVLYFSTKRQRLTQFRHRYQFL